MPLNSWLRNKLGGGRYSYEGKGSLLFDREKQMTTKIGKKQPLPEIKIAPPRAKYISSGRENEIPMKMLKRKSLLISSKRS